MSDFYTVSGTPSTGSSGQSAPIRSEFAAIETAMDKLPDITAHADEFWVNNAGATAVTTKTAAAVRTALSLVIGTNVQAYDADLTTWAGKTAPSGTVIGHTDTQTLTNKTIDLASNTLTTTLAQLNLAVSDADVAKAGVNSDITQLTALTSIVVSGSVAPIVVDNSTSGAVKLQFKDGGSSIGAIGGSVLYPFIVMDTGLTDLFHVDTAGNLVPQGKLDLSTAGQIQFPATQNASANANCLDDYEEGTWTPTGIGSTFTSATGTYTKIGNRCFVDCVITWPVTAAGNPTGFGGLPYTVSADGGAALGYSTEPTAFTLLVAATTATVFFYTLNGAQVLESTMSTDNIYASASFKV